MSEERKEESVKTPVANPEIEKIKADFKKEFEEFKTSLSKEMEKKDAIIKQLTEANDGLRASLVRQATTQPVEKPKEKTEEELYKERVESLAAKAILRMKRRIVKGEE